MLGSNLLRKLDMQDLIVFAYVYERGSVTGVSEALCVSQSTVSYCLRKLRAGLEDDLFIPSRGGMVPTEKADLIYPNILKILEKINICYAGELGADSVANSRVFNVQAPEYFEFMVLPRLLTDLRGEGSEVSINVHKLGSGIPADEMRVGEIDLVVCFGPNYHRKQFGLKSAVLLKDELVCVTDGISAPEAGAFTLDEFVSRRHVYPTPWTTTTNMVDGWLRRKGLSREIVARANTYGSALGLLRGTDYVLTLPRRIFDLLNADGVAEAIAPPPGFPSFTLEMVWTEQANRNQDNAWLRARIIAAVSGL